MQLVLAIFTGDHFTKGVGRSLMNFQIAVAWVIDETAGFYKWFQESLNKLVSRHNNMKHTVYLYELTQLHVVFYVDLQLLW